MARHETHKLSMLRCKLVHVVQKRKYYSGVVKRNWGYNKNHERYTRELVVAGDHQSICNDKLRLVTIDSLNSVKSFTVINIAMIIARGRKPVTSVWDGKSV